jgi:hypothetical protein
MTYGIKVAKTGKSVNSTDPRDFIFDSSLETIKIYAENSGSYNLGANSQVQIVVNHSLGFIPMCWLFSELKTDHFYMGVSLPSRADGFPSSYAQVYPGSDDTYVDATYFKFTLRNNSGSARTIRYYFLIFGDDAS